MAILVHFGCFLLMVTTSINCDNLEKSKNIYKRAAKTDTSKSSFTSAERQTIVDKHNTLRRIPSATNMRKMEWSTTLENVAKSFAAKCVFKHNDNRISEASIFPSIGENLHAQSSSYDEEASIQSWYDEVSDYTYSSNTCSAVCGHYTQVVWATTDKVGCGIKFCPSLTVPNNPTMSNAYVVVCNYAISGNLIGESPYSSGTSCSACPSELSSCDNGLCSAAAVTDKDKEPDDGNGATDTDKDKDDGNSVSSLTSTWLVWAMATYSTLRWLLPTF